MRLLQALDLFLRAYVISHAALAAETLALWQQLSVLEHTRLALRVEDRSTRYRHQVAPDGIQTLLAMEIEAQDRRTPPH